MNRNGDAVLIQGYKPHQNPKGRSLTPEQKIYNKKLSEMRVDVENSIERVMKWKILKGIYRHWRMGKGQIDGNNVLTTATVLFNREIKRSGCHGPLLIKF